MPEQALPPAERSFVRARVVALWLAALGAVLTLVGVIAWRELIHYERRGHQHLLPGAELAVRVDLEQVVLFEPVRRHLLPLVDVVPVGDAAPGGPARLARLREHGGLNLGLDLREVVFSQSASGAWAIALGGLLGGDAVERLEQVLAAEPGAGVQRDGRLLHLRRAGLFVGQADDGVVVIGPDAGSVTDALEANARHLALGLPTEPPAAWVASPHAVEARGGGGRPLDLRRLAGQLALGDPLPLSLEIELAAPAQASLVRSTLSSWIGIDADALPAGPRADWAGERALWARATLTSPSPLRFVLSTSWEPEELERGCRSLATWIAGRLSRPMNP